MGVASRLSAYAAAHGPREFDWQAANCCHFAARWVAAETGVDPMVDLPAVASARAAQRLIRTLGGSLVAAWSRQLGREPISPLLAQTGDIVRVPIDDNKDEAIGICSGRTAMIVARDGGVVHVGLQFATHAWRLP